MNDIVFTPNSSTPRITPDEAHVTGRIGANHTDLDDPGVRPRHGYLGPFNGTIFLTRSKYTLSSPPGNP